MASGWTNTDNFTEHVWALLLVDVDLADGDTLDFRVGGGGVGGSRNCTRCEVADRSRIWSRCPAGSAGRGWMRQGRKVADDGYERIRGPKSPDI